MTIRSVVSESNAMQTKRYLPPLKCWKYLFSRRGYSLKSFSAKGTYQVRTSLAVGVWFLPFADFLSSGRVITREMETTIVVFQENRLEMC